MKKSNMCKKFLSAPVQPYAITNDFTVKTMLEKMENISFQGRNLGIAYEVWKNALNDNCTIFMGFAGAMVPAGMRKLVVHLIENRYIDCFVSTGANLFHDIVETLGKKHYIGSANVDDNMLYAHGIDRIYDTFALESDFRDTDIFLGNFGSKLENRPYTTMEFLNVLGKELTKVSKEDGIVTSAYKHKVPIFCPAVGDSSIGIGLAEHLHRHHKNFYFDVIGDVEKSAAFAIQAKKTAVIYVGGGTPKNFIQQTAVTASIEGHDIGGHEYAIQFTADAPHWGGLSGCTFEEAQSWGKIAKTAKKVSVFCDATIGLPVVITGLSQIKAYKTRKSIPKLI